MSLFPREEMTNYMDGVNDADVIQFVKDHPEIYTDHTKFYFHPGGYSTLSFIPTLATMILGLLAGGIMKSDRTPWRKVLWFLVAGAICFALGMTIHWFGICPIVKRIWTPSWTLFSGGICLFLLAGFYAVVDILQFRRWAFPLVVTA